MITAVIPYRATHPDRERIHLWTRQRWATLFPTVKVIYCDDESENFARSGSRNKGIAEVETPYVAVIDDDTVISPVHFWEGLQLLLAGAPWVLPFGQKGYFNLNKEYTEEILNSPPNILMNEFLTPDQFDHQLMSWCGILILRTEDAQKYKYDENFDLGWGHEDMAYRLDLDNFLGRHERLEHGKIMHLWHERGDADFGTEGELANRKYFDEAYKKKYNWKDERLSVR